MFIIRQSKPEDVSTLQKMAKMVYFINLPPNEQIILNKIEHSNRCFAKLLGLGSEEPVKGKKSAGSSSPSASTGSPTSPNTSTPPSRKHATGITGLASMEDESEFFMFTMEEVNEGDGKTSPGGVVGTSQVRSHQGGPGNPNWAFKVSEKEPYSESLRFGTTHSVGQLYGDESGPTEIGGLIIQPSYRGHAERPGKFLSFVRFHFIGLYRQLFADRVLAEMMAPVTADGDNIFWDAFGRKFIPVKFAEADRFCQHNRAFIPELLPKEEIYLSLFPLEVQNAVGVVSRETIPARRLLESLGFRYRGFVDPFDGGPHLDAPTDEIPMVRDTRRVELGKATTPDKCNMTAIVSVLSRERGFRATQVNVEVYGENQIRMTAGVMAALGVKPGMQVGYTPVGVWVEKAEALATEARGQDKTTSKSTNKPKTKSSSKPSSKPTSKSPSKAKAQPASKSKGKKK